MLLLVILSIRRKTLFNQSRYKYYNIDINKCMLEILPIRRKTLFNQSKYTLY